ncbi:YgdI/YgdR family lipoprotein [Algoriphagus limi]|uniref:YgdI/YgdR family lipoprotein n=1 Tax=Algoriphagus limi TaxID=2975273 RepID=A0ABT2G8X8_9BACT|nr:YgdI/YgdR family lipoprotein [Algoriphagus limi]MCS5491696.1 YgdI/YgdR family lipoprotein [Algoriphagus limi]
MRGIRLFCFGSLLFILAGCESWLQDIGLVDVKKIKGPCTITLVDGTLIETPHTIEISIRTEVLTYRDEDGKIWSLFKDEYESYSCQ